MCGVLRVRSCPDEVSCDCGGRGVFQRLGGRPQQTPPVRPVSGTQEAQGELVFGLKGCGSCHTVSGAEREGRQQARMAAFLAREEDALSPYPASNLTHLASRGTFGGSVEDLTEANLRLWLEAPSSLKPGRAWSNWPRRTTRRVWRPRR